MSPAAETVEHGSPSPVSLGQPFLLQPCVQQQISGIINRGILGYMLIVIYSSLGSHLGQFLLKLGFSSLEVLNPLLGSS